MEIGPVLGPEFVERQIFGQDFIDKLKFFDCRESFKADAEIQVHPDLLNPHENLLQQISQIKISRKKLSRSLGNNRSKVNTSIRHRKRHDSVLEQDSVISQQRLP